MSLLLICHRANDYKQGNHCAGFIDLAHTCGHFLFHRGVDFNVKHCIAYLSELIGDQCFLFFLS